MITSISAFLLGAAFVAALAGLIAKRRAEQLRAQEEHRSRFYKHAERLLEDDGTPESVERLILWMAQSEESRSFLWSFVFAAMTGKLRDKGDPEVLKILQELPPHMRTEFAQAMMAFVLGITGNNMLLGPVVRRVMLFSIPNRGDGDIGPTSPVGPVLEFSRAHPARQPQLVP